MGEFTARCRACVCRAFFWILASIDIMIVYVVQNNFTSSNYTEESMKEQQMRPWTMAAVAWEYEGDIFSWGGVQSVREVEEYNSQEVLQLLYRQYAIAGFRGDVSMRNHAIKIVPFSEQPFLWKTNLASVIWKCPKKRNQFDWSSAVYCSIRTESAMWGTCLMDMGQAVRGSYWLGQQDRGDVSFEILKDSAVRITLCTIIFTNDIYCHACTNCYCNYPHLLAADTFNNNHCIPYIDYLIFATTSQNWLWGSIDNEVGSMWLVLSGHAHTWTHIWLTNGQWNSIFSL